MKRSAILLPNPLPPLAHSGLTVPSFYSMHAMAALFPLTAGLLLYGWRAAWVVLVVLLSATGAFIAWRRVATLGHQLRLPHVIWLAGVLALMLPAHLLTFSPGRGGDAPWPLLPAAAVILVMLMWMLGGLGAGRVHPVLVTYLLLSALFVAELIPHCVLQRHRLLSGDVRNCAENL